MYLWPYLYKNFCSAICLSTISLIIWFSSLLLVFLHFTFVLEETQCMRTTCQEFKVENLKKEGRQIQDKTELCFLGTYRQKHVLGDSKRRISSGLKVGENCLYPKIYKDVPVSMETFLVFHKKY